LRNAACCCAGTCTIFKDSIPTIAQEINFLVGTAINYISSGANKQAFFNEQKDKVTTLLKMVTADVRNQILQKLKGREINYEYK
jgi:hypothetical protein